MMLHPENSAKEYKRVGSLWEGFIIVIKVSVKGAEYLHITGTSIQDFRESDLSKASVHRSDMDKIQ